MYMGFHCHVWWHKIDCREIREMPIARQIACFDSWIPIFDLYIFKSPVFDEKILQHHVYHFRGMTNDKFSISSWWIFISRINWCSTKGLEDWWAAHWPKASCAPCCLAMSRTMVWNTILDQLDHHFGLEMGESTTKWWFIITGWWF